MDRRSFLGLGFGAAALGALPTGLFGAETSESDGQVALGGPLGGPDSPLLKKVEFTKLRIEVGAPKPFKVIHCSDTHLNLMNVSDLIGAKRAKDLAMYDRRLPHMSSSIAGFAACVLKARLENVPLIHTGDVWDYHSSENFRLAKDAFSAAGDVLYAIGNHEIRGHWEHAPDFDHNAIRARCDKYLPNPSLFSARVIGGVNFVAFDNCDGRAKTQAKIHELTKAEFKKGLPTVLAMHMPIRTDELEKHTLENHKAKPNNLRAYMYAMGGIERKFMEWVYEQPNFKAVLCGHYHEERQFKLTDTVTQYIAGAAYKGNAYEIEFV